MVERPVRADVAGGQLQGAYTRVDGARRGAIVLGPHSKMGGSMDDPVVLCCAAALTAAGFSTLRLNPRGAGSSAGSATWGGGDEVGDVLAACLWLRERGGIDYEAKASQGLPTVLPLVLAGYSMGGSIVGAAAAAVTAGQAAGVSCAGTVQIAPPWGSLASFFISGALYTRSLESRPLRRLVIGGDADQWTGASTFQRSAAALPYPKEEGGSVAIGQLPPMVCKILPRCDHFFRNADSLQAVGVAVDEFARALSRDNDRL